MDSWIDIDNIRKSSDGIEYHPLKPFIFPDTRILFLGSFPPQRKRWCIDFFYPNFINDHWRIEGLVFYDDKNHFVDDSNKRFCLEDIISHCRIHGIGFYDTAFAIRRLADNASDKFLEVVEPSDLRRLCSLSEQLQVIVTTGTKATETFCMNMGIEHVPKVGAHVDIPELNGVTLYRLPSSSRAYPLSLEKKAEAYRKVLRRVALTKI